MAPGPRRLREQRVNPDEPPIVLVPGIDGTALFFYRQQPRLSEHFDTVAFPLPTVDPASMTMESLVTDLAGLVEEISDSGAILLGESFGGALALSTALARPDLVRGLVIVNSFPCLDQRWRLTVAPRLLRIVPWGAMPLVRRYTSDRLHSPQTDKDEIAEFRRLSRFIDRNSYIRRLELLRDFDIRGRLAEVEAPTLFLAGDHDRLIPSTAWAHFMAERVRRSSVTVLEGFGHVCLIDDDLDLTDHVVPWWTSVTDATGQL